MRNPIDQETTVATHRREIWRYLRFLGSDTHLAEDLTQEVFLRAMQASYDHRGRGAQAAWLRTIARNLYRQHCRRPRAVDLDEAETVWVQHRGSDGGDGYVDAMRTCLEQLPDRLRQALTLRYRGGKSREAMADRLGLRPDGVKSLLRRARSLLRGCIERRLG